MENKSNLWMGKLSKFLQVFLLFTIISLHLARTSSQQNRLMKQCGVPANLNELPDFAQDEIRAVWKEYIPGKKCDKELLITEDILAVLAMFDKELERQGMRLALKGGQTEPTTTIGNNQQFSANEKSEEKAQKMATSEIPTTILPASSSSPLSTHKNSQMPSSSISGNPSATLPSFGPSTIPKGPRQIISSSVATGPVLTHKMAPSMLQNFDYDESKSDNDNDDVGALDGGNGNHDDQLEEEEIKRPIKQRIPNEYEDKDNNNNGDDTFTQGELAHQQPFYEETRELPFLKGAKPAVIRVFKQVLEDPETPSETRRMEEVHVLAVSYLNARQLAKFNVWSTERRKRIHLREHQLSRPAREALEQLTKSSSLGQEQMELLTRITPELRSELHQFAMAKKEMEKRGEEKRNE